jgi:hypothetical protein
MKSSRRLLVRRRSGRILIIGASMKFVDREQPPNITTWFKSFVNYFDTLRVASRARWKVHPQQAPDSIFHLTI